MQKKAEKKTKKENPHKLHRIRVRKQVSDYGIDTMLPHQLLELLLFPYIPMKDTNPIAHALIERFGSLENVLFADPIDLKSVKNMTESAAFYLPLLPKIMPYIKKNSAQLNIRYLKTQKDATSFFLPLLENEALECFYTVSLNINFKILGVDLLHRGESNRTEANAANIIKISRYRGAKYVIIAHNHPAGNSQASDDDLVATENIATALAMVNIHLLDHYIIAESKVVSINTEYKGDSGMGFISQALLNSTHLFSQQFVSENTELLSAIKEANKTER